MISFFPRRFIITSCTSEILNVFKNYRKCLQPSLFLVPFARFRLFFFFSLFKENTHVLDTVNLELHEGEKRQYSCALT